MALAGFSVTADRSALAVAADFSRLLDMAGRSGLWPTTAVPSRKLLSQTAPRSVLALVPSTPFATVAGSHGSLATDARGCGLAFTGILFEPDRIAADCGLSASAPDAVLAAAWLERHQGQDLASALNRLAGDYALARWDPAQQRLVLATAPMATRSLYFSHSADGVCFASSLAVLFRFPSVPRVPSRLGMVAHVSGVVLDPFSTLFDGVQLLPGGTMVEVHPTGIQRYTIWAADPTRRLRLRRDQDYVEAARALLDHAVKVRVRGPKPPALTISGGLDSSGIAATAARLLPGVPLDTYTGIPSPTAPLPIAKKQHYNSEQQAVQSIADMHPTLRPQFHFSEGLDPLETDPRPLFLASGFPAIGAGHSAWFDPAIQAIRADGHQTLLVGNLGNYGLSFDGFLCFPDLIVAGRLDLVVRKFPQMMRFLKKPILPYGRQVLGMVFPQARQVWQRWRNKLSFAHEFSPLRREAIEATGLEQAMAEWNEQGILGKSRDSRVLRAHAFNNRATRHIEGHTLFRARYGLDLFDPLADRDLLDFCLAIPVEQYVLDGRSRSLARRVLADRLPDAVVNNFRVGRQNPEWFHRISLQRDSLMAEIEELERSSLASSLIDLPRLKRLLEDWPADAQAAETRRFDYESLLPRGIQMGRYLRWVEGGN